MFQKLKLPSFADFLGGGRAGGFMLSFFEFQSEIFFFGGGARVFLTAGGLAFGGAGGGFRLFEFHPLICLVPMAVVFTAIPPAASPLFS